jgi:hypothetical protein
MLAYRSYRPSRVLAAACALGLSACAHEALDNQFAASREAIDQARIVGAPQAAPADYENAVTKLERANATADKDDAMRLAQQAQIDANLAHAKTDAAQAKFAAAEMEKSNHVLRDALNQRPATQGGEP